MIVYFKIDQNYLLFECIFEPNIFYLNRIDCKIYSEIERQESINSDESNKCDFQKIDQIDRNEIVSKYLVDKNNKRLLRKSDDKDYFSKFHCYVEENLLVEDWYMYEKKELTEYAAEWCKQKNIRYSLEWQTSSIQKEDL